MGLFKKKPKEISTNKSKSTIIDNKSSESESFTNDTQITIADIENVVIKTKNTPDEATALDIAGMAYLKGEYGAQENIDKALFYFERLEEIGELKGKYMVGKCNVIKGLKTGEKLFYSLGVIRIYEAYKLGYSDAEKDLRINFESGFFENIHSFDEFIAFLEDCSTVK